MQAVLYYLSFLPPRSPGILVKMQQSVDLKDRFLRGGDEEFEFDEVITISYGDRDVFRWELHVDVCVSGLRGIKNLRIRKVNDTERNNFIIL